MVAAFVATMSTMIGERRWHRDVVPISTRPDISGVDFDVDFDVDVDVLVIHLILALAAAAEEDDVDRYYRTSSWFY